MDPQPFSRGCYGAGSPPPDTKGIVVDFLVNVETTALATPEEIQSFIINALAKNVVDAIAKNGCDRRRLGSTRKLEVASVHANLPSFHELGSCEITDTTESLSCSTYMGAISVVYTVEGTNSWEEGVTSNSLTAIQGIIDSGSVTEDINGILEGNNVQVTSISYAGPDIKVANKPIIVGSSSENFVAEDTGALTGIGKGMLAMAAVLALIAMFILYCYCRDSRRRRREKESAYRSNKSHNTDEFSDEGTVKFTDESIEDPFDRYAVPERDHDSVVESRGFMSHFDPYILGLFGKDPLSNVVEDEAPCHVSATNVLGPQGHFAPATAASPDMLRMEPMSATRDTNRLADRTTFDDDEDTTDGFSILSISPVRDSSDSPPSPPLKRKSVFKQFVFYRGRNISTLNEIEPGDKEVLETPVQLEEANEMALSEHHGLDDDAAESPRKITNPFKSRTLSLIKKSRKVVDSMPAEDELIKSAEPTEEAVETTLSNHRGLGDEMEEYPPKTKNHFKSRTLSLIKRSRTVEEPGYADQVVLDPTPEEAFDNHHSFADEIDESPRKTRNHFKARTLSRRKRSSRVKAPEDADAFKPTSPPEAAVEALLPNNHDLNEDTTELTIVSISPMPTTERDASKQTKPSKAKSVLRKLAPSLAKKSPDEGSMRANDQEVDKDATQGDKATAGATSNHRESLAQNTVPSTPPTPSRRIKKKNKQSSPERKSVLKARTLSFGYSNKSREDLDPEDLLAMEYMQKVDATIALRSGQVAPGVEFVEISEEEKGFLSSVLRKKKP